MRGTAASGLANIRAALALDTTAPEWPITQADAVLCFNMIHIAPWTATIGLIQGAARVLGQGGKLILYGPYAKAAPTPPPVTPNSTPAYAHATRNGRPRPGSRQQSRCPIRLRYTHHRTNAGQ